MFKAAVFGFILAGCSSVPPRSDIKIGSSEFMVDVSFYQSKSPAQKSILIVPPTGGTNYIDRSYAEAFQKNGMDVYILNYWTGDDEVNFDLGVHQRFYTRAQKAIGLVIDHIQTPKIGLLGTSVGGLHGAVAASSQPRLDSVFVITAGVSIPEVVVHSDQKAMINAKAKRYEKYGFQNDEQYFIALSKEFFLDPTKLPPIYKSKKLGLSIGIKDTTVTTKTQNQLLELWNPKKVIQFENGHFWAIVKTWFFKKSDIVEFFQKSETL